jgi:hypothetical protein
MNETIRTCIFVGAGAVAALAAFAARPNLTRNTGVGPGGIPIPVGTQLFPKFTDPLDATSLEIKRYDEATARQKNFVVKQQANGVWSIPSHGGYPADAADQLKSVSEALAGLEILGVASERTADHELYGVLDPTKAEVGATGVGTLVTLTDAKGDDLLALIVGKEVDGAPNQHFVRKPSEDLVTVTKIDMSKLPMEFDKWIEKDLLKISTFDVSKVTLKDYALLPTEQGLALLNRMEAELSYLSDKGEWTLDKLMVSRKPATIGPQEELNKQKLDDLRNALGDVKIVDVVRKPAGLGNSLRVSSDQLTLESRQNLQRFGFYPQPAADGSLDIYGANGEVLIETKDGVRYFLRFGDVADNVETAPPPKPEPGQKPEEEKVKIHRYLFVSTQVAPSVLVPPILEPEEAGPAAEPAKPADDAAKADAAKTDEKAKTDDKTGEEKPPVIDPKQAEQERIKRENKRKLDAYNDKRKKAEVRVKELNARFADWYYVVSEDVYKKIRLVRSDIIKESAGAKEEGFGPDAFRSLEQGGIKGTPKPATPATPMSPGFPGAGFPPM